jgi:hypothetical protein
MPDNFFFPGEPFRAWNRLEPRPRKADFDKVLECGVHDALWMLTRQWQFGELDGEDTGSAIFAKIWMQTTALTRLKQGNGKVQPYDQNLPLENKIESVALTPDYKTRLDGAFTFLQFLESASKKLSINDFGRKTYKDQLKALFPLASLPQIDRADTADHIIQKAEMLSNERMVELQTVSAPVYFDGFSLYQNAVANERETISKLAASNPAHTAMITAAVQQFTEWFKKNYGDQFNITNEAWNPEQLEYQFSCALPEKTGTNSVLTASEYYTGSLDWFAFDVNKKESVDGLSDAATPAEMTNVKSSLLTIIPTQATFAGAPNSRWWQFENGNVDLGNISAEATDLAKLVFTEYALMFNNDWFILPHTVPVGSLSEIKGIVVKDVFGEQSFVEAAVQGDTDDWSAWGMFNLSTMHQDGVRNLPADTRLFIPPATVKTIESEPVEEVHIVRDESSNNVWAIETKIPDGVGGCMDGYEKARIFNDLLEKHEDQPATNGFGEAALLKYTLSNTIPENWIPFLPVHVKNSARSVQLQRASMPRLFKNNYSHTRPRTELLRRNINSNNEQANPYYIHEEEIPRAGVQLKSTFQRTRWYNGMVVNWYGYRKNTGRGEGSSALKYDIVETVKV